MRLLLVVPARTLEQMGRCQLTFSLAQNWVSMGEDFSMGEGGREGEGGCHYGTWEFAQLCIIFDNYA